MGYSVGYGYGRQFVDRRTDWRDVILPAAPTQSPGVQSMSYVIRGLESGQNYEAKVQARNKFGWSPISEAFTFQTTDTGQYEFIRITGISGEYYGVNSFAVDRY